MHELAGVAESAVACLLVVFAQVRLPELRFKLQLSHALVGLPRHVSRTATHALLHIVLCAVKTGDFVPVVHELPTKKKNSNSLVK